MHLAGRVEILLIDQGQVVFRKLLLVINLPVERPGGFTTVLELLVPETVSQISFQEKIGTEAGVGGNTCSETYTLDGIVSGKGL